MLSYCLGNNMFNFNHIKNRLNPVKILITHAHVILFFLSSHLYAEDKVNLITYSNYPPYLYHKDNQQTGLYLEIVELTLKAINQPFKLETLPFKRAMNKTKAGKGIMIGVLKNHERTKKLDFSDYFYLSRVSVFLNKLNGTMLTSIAELDGLTISTLLGWSYGESFDKARKEKRFTCFDGKIETNFKLLARNRVDAVIHTELSSLYIIDRLGLTDKITLGSLPLSLSKIRIAVKKGTHQKLIEKFNLKLKDPKHIRKINALIEQYRMI